MKFLAIVLALALAASISFAVSQQQASAEDMLKAYREAAESSQDGVDEQAFASALAKTGIAVADDSEEKEGAKTASDSADAARKVAAAIASARNSNAADEKPPSPPADSSISRALEVQCSRFVERIRTLEQENTRLKNALSKYERAAAGKAETNSGEAAASAGRVPSVSSARQSGEYEENDARDIAPSVRSAQNARAVSVSEAYARAAAIIDGLLNKKAE